MRRAGALVPLLLAAGCGGGGSGLADELAAATHLLDVPVSAVEVVGRDVHGSVASPDPDALLEVLEVEVDQGEAFTWLSGAAELGRRVKLVRDPARTGRAEALVEEAERVLVVVIPLVDPTRDGNVLDARLIGLDERGAVVASDWRGDEQRRLEEVLAAGEGGQALATAIGALVDRRLGRPASPEGERLAGILED